MSFQIPKVEIGIDDIDTLRFDIYTIGYKEEGECLLLLLCDGDKVLHCTITDCYSEDGYNHADFLLHELGAMKIDAFIWTHPDIDHSTGITSFLDKYDPDADARIFIPAWVNDNIIETEAAKKAWIYLLDKYNQNKRYDIDYVSLNKGQFSQPLKFRIYDKKYHRHVDCTYTFILPNNDVEARRSRANGKVLLNDYSIFYIVTFNDQNYLFCGDLSKQNVKFIKKDWLEDVVFVKIPHHGSTTLGNFQGKLISAGVNDVISTCTTFKPKQLPNDKVLKSYKSFSKAVYCTGKIEDSPRYNYGCVLNQFNANMKDNASSCSGNAFEYKVS